MPRFCDNVVMGTQTYIYLDQNKWVELLRASIAPGGDREGNEVLVAMRAGLAEGSIIVPLSAAHYLETWNRRDWESRHALAGLMREISGLRTLAPVQRILNWEIERLLLRDFRHPNCACELPDVSTLVHGQGVEHAFDSPMGRLRLVESVARNGVPEGRPVNATPELLELLAKVRALPDDSYEWWSLAGFKDSLEHDDWETRSEHRLGAERVSREEELAQRIAKDGYLRSRLRDYLIAEEFVFANDDINRIAFWHNSNIDLLVESWQAGGPGYGSSLIDSMPTRACIVAIRMAKHSNPQWKWQQHDQTDVAALAAAVPCCDVVVTERQWAHVFRSSRLDARFGTRVLSKIADLIPVIAGAAG
jgi:hypothetical protein